MVDVGGMRQSYLLVNKQFSSELEVYHFANTEYELGLTSMLDSVKWLPLKIRFC